VKLTPASKEKYMQSIIKKISFALAVLALVGSGANAQGPGHRCSVDKLHGQYGFKIDGSNVTPAPGKIAAVGTQSFDGAGNFSATNYLSLNGVVGLYSFTGTYTVNPDCTGIVTAHFAGGITSSMYFVLVENGSRLYSISVDPGSIVTGVYTKVESHSDEGR
jgi:hypothetical protein